VEPAFSLMHKEELSILDICFGLGINTLATLHYFRNRQNRIKKIRIFSPELDEKLLQQLSHFPYPKELLPYKAILQKVLEHGHYEEENIAIELFRGDAREYVKGLSHIDVVYQDAFSPKKNPILWTVEYFRDIYDIMQEDGVLTTYSIATPVRLALDEVGFFVYEKEIPGLKKITIASKRELPLRRVDMVLKRQRAASKPLRDANIQKI
jgi:tRNA U34 5-methylaminomethyl-2-thiouridine-forming methyltransferase MnmC